ncbi:MAG: ATP-binding cassette domain-containing protein [Prolixibacteraceae bacterium]|nr:ATP-binding cassette domain-containing protein [Prolixibacteraceae bacterium]
MPSEPIIELINADIFQRENLILAQITTTIYEGEFVYVVGRVGSGKSSLIKTLNAELPLQNGFGIIAGFELHNMKTHDLAFLRRKLGVVFQDFRLLTDRSVYKNLEFILKSTGWKQDKTIRDRIFEVLESVGMEKVAQKMPHQLSGGEQQRIVIARAVLNHPAIILADEPTGNLDPETSEEILALLTRLNKAGITVVMATHDYILIGKHRARTLICENASIKDTASYEGNVDFESLLN